MCCVAASIIAVFISGCDVSHGVARAGDAQLTDRRVVAMVAAAAKESHGSDPGAAARAIVERWALYQSLAGAAVARDTLADTGTLRVALEAAVVAARLDQWLGGLAEQAVARDSGAYRARYNAGEPLAARDVVFAAAAGDSGRRAGERAWAKAGAYRASVRPATMVERAKVSGGEYDDLGVFEKGRLAPELERAILATRPGTLSAVVRTPFGSHVIYRPTFDEVRGKVVARDQPATVQGARQLYIATVDSAWRTRIVSNGVAVVRAVARAPDAHRKDTSVIARTAVRDLTGARLVWWLDVFPPAMTAQVAGAPDSILKEFVVNIVGYEVMLRSADSAGVTLDGGRAGRLKSGYVGEIVRAWGMLGVDPRILRDSARSVHAEQRFAERRVDQYLDGLFAPRRDGRFVIVSPAVERVARARYPVDIDSVALGRLVDRLRRDKRRDDSVADAKLPTSAVPMPK